MDVSCFESSHQTLAPYVLCDVSLWLSDVPLFQSVFDVGFWFPSLFLHSLSECDTQLGAEDRSRSAKDGQEWIQLGMLISISTEVHGEPCHNCCETVQAKSISDLIQHNSNYAAFHSTRKVRISNFLLGRVQYKGRLPIWKLVRKSRSANII